LGRLQQEVYSDNGGGLVYAPFLSEAGIQEILKDQFVGEETTESGFSPEQMWLHLWNTVAFGYPTVEASKHAKREHLGVLIGENCSPGLTTTRTFLNEA
jgi:hypothetical protein